MAPSFPQWQFHCLSSSIWVTLSLCHSLIEPRCWHRPPYQVNNLPDLLWPSQRSQISFDTPQDLPKTSKAPQTPSCLLPKPWLDYLRPSKKIWTNQDALSHPMTAPWSSQLPLCYAVTLLDPEDIHTTPKGRLGPLQDPANLLITCEPQKLQDSPRPPCK